MIEINKNPSRRELDWFGLMFLAFFAIIGGLVYWHGPNTVAYGLWAAASAVTMLYYAIPSMRRPLYLGWMYAAFPIGWTVSHLVLAAVYYLVLTPTGLIMRMLGHDPMNRRLDRDAPTYWTPRGPQREPAGYFRQF